MARDNPLIFQFDHRWRCPRSSTSGLRALTETNVGIGALVAVVYSIAAFAQVLMGTLMSRFA